MGSGDRRPPPGRAPWRDRARRLSPLALAVLADGWYAVRAFLAAVLAGWAGVLALPGDSFGRSTGYAWFAARGPEEAWAAGFGLAAAACASALVWRRAWWRMASALAAAAAYGVLAYGVWRGNHLSPGTWAYGCCAALSHALVLRNAAAAPGTPERRARPDGA